MPAVKPALATAFWLWMAGCAAVGALAYAQGANLSSTIQAVSIALLPATAGLILLPSLIGTGARAALAATWLTAGVALAAFTGGAFSPLAAALLIPPALARAVGSPRVAETGAAAVLSYALAAWISASGVAPWELGAWPQLQAVLALAFVGGLIALERGAVLDEEALSRRIAEVSHELRTPLTHIIGFAEMIEREIFSPAGARNVEYAGLIRRSGNHLLELVNDLLDLSKMEAGRYVLDLETFDARAIVEEVAQLSADAAARKTIALNVDAPDTPLMVRADVRALRRMLTNTAGNAIKFTQEGGRVTLAARAENGKLVLDTIDNGPGIPAAERARLGRPYVRGATGAHAEGTGLGLALVRALAEEHGGVLSFHDAPGGGALVRVEAPVLAD